MRFIIADQEQEDSMNPKITRTVISVLLIPALVSFGCGGKTVVPPTPGEELVPAVLKPLRQDVQKSYLELFRISPKLEYSQEQIDEMHKYLDGAKDYCVNQFKRKEDQYGNNLTQAMDDLKRDSAKLTDAQRHDAHCKIQNLRALKSQVSVLKDHAIPVAYQNKQAKLDLIEKWPSQEKEIQQEIASGSYKDRRWGNVKDIGFREIASGQHDDIKTGQDAIKQMKESGLMPKELENNKINDYVDSVAQKVAKHSDLTVPLHVTILNSKEINAFALPGGFLFVERGLLEAVDDESELAGVIGHELGHDVARHGHKLMTKANIASIFYQAAEVAAVVLTGGAASIGAYYALQYGFYGIGLVLNLELLGVSREYELQADQLGIQYAWNSGYDPSGFIRFFDKMATKEGYVEGISWFYDHPPFYERMVDAEREIMFLPKKSNLVVQTPEFQTMKKELAKVTAEAKESEKNRPSLLAPEPGCPAPKKSEYESGKAIETLCTPPSSASKK
jgi:hypothetical protein